MSVINGFILPTVLTYATLSRGEGENVRWDGLFREGDVVYCYWENFKGEVSCCGNVRVISFFWEESGLFKGGLSTAGFGISVFLVVGRLGLNCFTWKEVLILLEI